MPAGQPFFSLFLTTPTKSSHDLPIMFFFVSKTKRRFYYRHWTSSTTSSRRRRRRNWVDMLAFHNNSSSPRIFEPTSPSTDEYSPPRSCLLLLIPYASGQGHAALVRGGTRPWQRLQCLLSAGSSGLEREDRVSNEA